MPADFVEDEIGVVSEARVREYFEKQRGSIEEAAWALAYEHSTRDKSAEDDPGPVPYLATLRAPFDRIVVRE
jgi:hypothetical protein